MTGTWRTRFVTKEIWDVGNSTVCRADHFWGGREGGGDDGVRDWLILKKMYTCTLYILEVHIGKKRILHKYTVQKKKSSTFSELKKPYSRCSLGWQSWQHKLYFPTVMIKRFCICTCVPGKKDSQHKDLFLPNGFFFKSTTPVVTNLGQGPRSLGAEYVEWVIAPPIMPSFFVLFCIFYDSLLIFMLKANTISFVTCTFFAEN